jgi:adenosylcobinamide-GDP ribazoletransferase
MKILKSFIIAISSYSKVPMPQIEIISGDMDYVMSFFPAVGAIIGLFECLWFWICRSLGLNDIADYIIAALIPIIITGGFHVDGFMDTSDAICSYKEREERLKILKDSHVGAFAVIHLLAAAGIFMAAVSQMNSWQSRIIFALSFILARCLSAVGVLHFESANHNGSLFYVASNSNRRVNIIVVLTIAAAVAAAMLICSFVVGILTILAAILTFLYYKKMSYKKFGGITGDLAGYFVVVCEIACAVGIAVGGLIVR